MEANSDFALLFMAGQFNLDSDASPFESVLGKSASFPKATHRCHSIHDSHPPTSFFHDVLVATDNGDDGSIPATVSMRLVATCSDGGGRPGAATKSDWHPSLALARSRVDWACLCSTSRECDPLGDSTRVSDQTVKVSFVHWDDLVEDLTAAAANPSFGGSVLPWRLNARPFRLQSGGLQEGNHIDVEDRIVIQKGVAIGSRLG